MTDQPATAPATSASELARPGNRPRATERPVRCDMPKSEDGRPCRRNAGAGTEHPGIGPCSKHDDGAWQRPPLAENTGVQEAFLRAVSSSPVTGIRPLIEPLGYHRRDVEALLTADSAFEARYVEARGYDVDAIRNELQRRAMGEGSSDKLFEFLARLRLPEARDLQRMRFDGRLEVQPAPMIDPSKLTLEEKRELRRLLEKGRPELDALTDGQRAAAELLPGPSPESDVA